MERHISATEAARSFSDLINRVRYRGDVFVVRRGGEAICRISPVHERAMTVKDLVRLLRVMPTPDKEYLDTVERLSEGQPKVPKRPWGR